MPEAHAPGGGGAGSRPGAARPPRPPPSTGSPPTPARAAPNPGWWGVNCRPSDRQSAGLPLWLNGLRCRCVRCVSGTRSDPPAAGRSPGAVAGQGAARGAASILGGSGGSGRGLRGRLPGNLEVFEDSLEGVTGKSRVCRSRSPSRFGLAFLCGAARVSRESLPVGSTGSPDWAYTGRVGFRGFRRGAMLPQCICIPSASPLLTFPSRSLPPEGEHRGDWSFSRVSGSGIGKYNFPPCYCGITMRPVSLSFTPQSGA